MDKAVARRTRWNSGQGLTEFALVFPVLLLVILVIIEVAHIVFFYNFLTMAAREASRYGAGVCNGVDGNCGEPQYKNCAGIRAAANRVGNIIGIQTITITYDNGDFTSTNGNPNFKALGNCDTFGSQVLANGDRVTVTVTANYSPLIPIFNFSSAITSTSSSTILFNIPAIIYNQ